MWSWNEREEDADLSATQMRDAWTTIAKWNKAKLDAEAPKEDPYTLKACIALLYKDCGKVPPHVEVDAYKRFTNP